MVYARRQEEEKIPLRGNPHLAQGLAARRPDARQIGQGRRG
jgi:hypothetical protein